MSPSTRKIYDAICVELKRQNKAHHLYYVIALSLGCFFLYRAIDDERTTYQQSVEFQIKELRTRIDLLEDGKIDHKITWRSLGLSRCSQVTLQSSADGKHWSDVAATHSCYLRTVIQ